MKLTYNQKCGKILKQGFAKKNCNAKGLSHEKVLDPRSKYFSLEDMIVTKIALEIFEKTR